MTVRTGRKREGKENGSEGMGRHSIRVRGEDGGEGRE